MNIRNLAFVLPYGAFLAAAVQPGGSPPKPPILTVLDRNQDGVISTAEIADAPAALMTLDQNGDGRLTPDECRPPRPDTGPGSSMGELGHGRMGSEHRPPLPMVDAVLDADQNGVLDAEEIANASAALRQLDKNDDGMLTLDECVPPRSERTQIAR